MKKEISDVIIRKAKLGDEYGIVDIIREGLKRKTSNYTGTRKITQDKVEKTKKSLESKHPEGYHFVAVDKSTNKIVGSLWFGFRGNHSRLRHRGELGWGVHPDYQGKGIATKMLTEALKFAKKKGFKRAEAEMAIENKASWKLALRCGFKIEGTKKKAMLTDDGRYIDTYIVGKIL
ncbi:MAG TPA: GNAT family N-acetyltransferase [Candidatus Pacearchaeota archaeon]|nr:GNAT family N-acetyltransferase [Candidatus Pacearchaeota archaeon]